MSADTNSGLQEVDPRVTIGEVNGGGDRDTQFVGHAGEFVGQRDVDVAVSVFNQLAEFGRKIVRHQAFPLGESLVDLQRSPRGFRANSADDARVMDKLVDSVAGEKPLRAMGEIDILTDAQARSIPGSV